jgi:hypothetical protein
VHSNLAALLVSTHYNFNQHDFADNIMSGREREEWRDMEYEPRWVIQVISVMLIR